jgi:hypothetical protein
MATMESSKSSASTFRVGTYNVHGWANAHGRDNLDMVANVVKVIFLLHFN